MRSIALTGALFIATLAMNAQQRLSLTPQVGFENSKTSINYNNLGSFSPLNGQFNPQISLRLDYKFKQGFGPYIGASTSRSVVLYSFSDIENGMNLYNVTKANMQLRFEAGYQFTTSQLFFSKTKTSSSKTKTQSKGSCGSYSSHSCCSRNNSSSSSRCQSRSNLAKTSRNKGGWVRLQPSAGIGFIPSPKTDVITKTQNGLTTYEYRAGNWNTAFMTGMGFEFGRNKQRLVNVSVNYFTAIGNMSKQTVSGMSGTKTSYSTLQSNASGWNMRIGIPFTLAEKKPFKHRSENRVKRTGCGERRVIEYKYRCRMQ